VPDTVEEHSQSALGCPAPLASVEFGGKPVCCVQNGKGNERKWMNKTEKKNRAMRIVLGTTAKPEIVSARGVGPRYVQVRLVCEAYLAIEAT
jgi:hypothetical protein